LRFDINIKSTVIPIMPADRLTEDITQLLGSNIYGKISVSDICRKLNFSRTYISARFKQTLGMTINEYMTKLKIEEAKTLIREEKHSISQISEMLCYDNPHYFSRVFKKVTNMSPREYKESVKI